MPLTSSAKALYHLARRNSVTDEASGEYTGIALHHSSLAGDHGAPVLILEVDGSMHKLDASEARALASALGEGATMLDAGDQKDTLS